MKNLKMMSFEGAGTSWEQKILFLETKLNKMVDTNEKN